MQKYFTRKYYSDKSSDSTPRSKALTALVWVSIFWGTTWLISKQGVKYMPAMQLASIRQIIAGLLFIIFFLIKKQPLPKGKQWRVIIILSILNFMMSNGLSTWGIKYIPSGLGAIMGAIFPLWLVIITMLAGKKMPGRVLTGLLLGFGGVCLIFYEHLKDFANPDFKFGILLSLSATISWAFGTLYTKQQAAHYNPYFSLGFQMFISGVVLYIILLVTGTSIPLSEIPAISWGSIAYLVLFGSVFTFAAYIYTLQHLPTALASVYAYINPIVAVLLGALLVNEKITAFIIIGGVITVTGVYLVNNSLKRRNEPEVAEAKV